MSNRHRKVQKKKQRAKVKEQQRQRRRARSRAGGTDAHDRTPNAQMILDAMGAGGVKGNYRDYVLLVGDRLIDWKGSHGIVNTDDNKPAHVQGIRLVHKKNLKSILPEEVAAQFWHPKLGRKGAKQ